MPHFPFAGCWFWLNWYNWPFFIGNYDTVTSHLYINPLANNKPRIMKPNTSKLNTGNRYPLIGAFLMELSFLNGRAPLAGRDVFSLITY